MDWSNKVAIVTGASSGIGLEVARMLASRGVRVALVARTKSKLDELARELAGAVAFPLDVTDRAALVALPARVVERFGRLDFVVNNAGVNNRGAVRERTTDELAQILDANLVAPVLLTRASLPHVERGGVVVNVASLAGKVPLPHEATYSASKAGLRAFGRALGVELGGEVRVANVNPGPVDTGFFGDIHDVPDIVFSQPMSTAQQIAEAVVRAIETDVDEIDVPALSGRLATLGYLSTTAYKALRPILEKRGAAAKKKYIARRGA